MPDPTPPILASGIPVHCAHRELVDVTTLVPNPRNTNTHSDKQLALYAKIIRHRGWRSAIVVSNRSGFIVKGHGARLAAGILGVELVPIDRQDFVDEADEWAHMTADNELGRLSENDDDALKSLLEEMETRGLDLELAGFADTSLEEVIEKSTPEENEGLGSDVTDDVPVETQTYIVPIALTRKEYRAWEAKQAEAGTKNHKRAFCKLLNIQ